MQFGIDGSDGATTSPPGWINNEYPSSTKASNSDPSSPAITLLFLTTWIMCGFSHENVELWQVVTLDNDLSGQSVWSEDAIFDE
jgi:hypothetical protein